MVIYGEVYWLGVQNFVFVFEIWYVVGVQNVGDVIFGDFVCIQLDFFGQFIGLWLCVGNVGDDVIDLYFGDFLC